MKKILLIFIFLLLFGVLPQASIAQTNGLTLSITPPLIKNNVSPGQIWKSYIKLVNNNNEPITAYVQVVDFKSGGKSSSIEFINLGKENNDSKDLSSWIVIDTDPIQIPANSGKEIPFIIDVPEDSQPGGHYAAILAGTQPPNSNNKGASIRISSMLASLILLNVSGEVREEGQIREFSLPKQLYNSANVDFTMRFENKGNVHLQPQGEILVTNLFNKERGRLKINHESQFGNVLPGEIREWNFNWQGEDSILEMGRYKAQLLLSYGENGRQTDERVLYFWIIYWKPLIIAFSSLLLLLVLIIVLIRFYIKKAVLRTQSLYGIDPDSYGKRQAPVAASASIDRQLAGKNKAFKPFMAVITVIALGLIGIGVYYIIDQNSDNKSYKIEKVGEDNFEFLNDELFNELQGLEDKVDEISNGNESFDAPDIGNGLGMSIKILNGSGVSNKASEKAEILEQAGYFDILTGNADSFDYSKTEVYYKNSKESADKAAKMIAEDYTLIKADESQNEDLLIIVGE